MGYRLRYQGRLFELPDGEFVIGRGESCQLALDDPLVSRRHAVLLAAGERLTVEDLGSRNGVQVNGELIQGKLALAPGDVVRIGSQELAVLGGAVAAETRSMARTQRGDVFGMVGELANKSLALGRFEEAERLLAGHLSKLTDAMFTGRFPDEIVDRACGYASRLATGTAKAEWFDYVVRAYLAQCRPGTAEVIEELHAAVRKVGPVNLPALREWIAVLKAAALSPSDRFLLNRIESLERVAAVR